MHIRPFCFYMRSYAASSLQNHLMFGVGGVRADKEMELREESNSLLGENRGEKFSLGPPQSMSPKWEESGERVYRAWIFVIYSPSNSCRIRVSHSKSSFIHLLSIDELWRSIFEIQNFSSLPSLRFLVPNNKKSLSDFLFPHFQSNPNKIMISLGLSALFISSYFHSSCNVFSINKLPTTSFVPMLIYH